MLATKCLHALQHQNTAHRDAILAIEAAREVISTDQVAKRVTLDKDVLTEAAKSLRDRVTQGEPFYSMRKISGHAIILQW